MSSPKHQPKSLSTTGRQQSLRVGSSSSLVERLPLVSREFVIFNDSSSNVFFDKSEILFAANASSRGFVLQQTQGVDDDDDTSFEKGEQQHKEEVVTTTGCCSCWKGLSQHQSAKGYVIAGVARGAIIMANVFLSSALIYLASQEAGCVDPIEEEILDDCDGTVYGFRPAALVTNIATISGLLGAFFTPIIGAIIDYTSYRRTVGIATAAFSTLVQGVQIYTVESTWFVMSILQALVGFTFAIQLLVTYSYLPEIARHVGGVVMNGHTKWFTFTQFLSQILFLMVIIIIGIGLGLDTVQSGQAGQILVTVVSTAAFAWAWVLCFPECPPRRPLPEGTSLWLEGFRQNWRTFRKISRHYKKGVFWFMLATLVAEAGVTSLVPVSITFLTDELKLGGLEIGVVFLIALIGSLPGTFVGAWITSRTSPRESWMWNLICWCVVTFSGTFALHESRAYLAYVWAFLWGILLGWYYPVGNLFFSLCLPSGQEAEMTGFLLYMYNALAWLPPFLVSFIVEADGNTRWGFMSLMIFQGLALVCLMRVAPWEEVMVEATKIVPGEEL